MENSYCRWVLVCSVLALCLGSRGARCELTPNFYHSTCPQLYYIVRHHVFVAMRAEMRMGASLLRLHFHDCFVNVTVTLDRLNSTSLKTELLFLVIFFSINS